MFRVPCTTLFAHEQLSVVVVGRLLCIKLFSFSIGRGHRLWIWIVRIGFRSPIPSHLRLFLLATTGVFSFRRRSRVLSKLLNFTCFPQAIKPLDEHIFRPPISPRSHRIGGHFRHDDAAFQELCKFCVEHCVRMPSNDERVIYAPKSL